MVKPILQLYPMIPAASEEEREALRPIGRNVDRYQEVVHGMTELVKVADELGFWGVSTIEHHFHSEGYEVGPSPAVLNAYWAAHVKQARVGQLGFTMSAQNPIRVAEDTAILDHLTRGRSFVGFSRGFQSRWTNVLGQHLGARATLSPDGQTEHGALGTDTERLTQLREDDAINRRIFEENIDIVMKAWTEQSFEYKSPNWQIPFPHAEGIDWAMQEATSRLGAPNEMGADGRLRQISVAPAPYTDPHPPVFVASNASLETVEYAGARGFIPTYFSSSKTAGKFGGSYVESAQNAGRHFAFGQNQAVVRWMQTGPTTEAAYQAVTDYDLEIYRNLYRPLAPRMRYDAANPVQSVLDSGLYLAGTTNEVRDQFVDQWKALPAEYCVLIFHYAQQPLESVIENMKAFMKDIKPALDEMTDYEK